VVIGLDLASAEHEAVVLTAAGQRLTRFRIPHTRAGLEKLLRRITPAALGRAGGARVFTFEATGHVWEAVAYVLRARGERHVVVNPLATFRVREVRQLSQEKTDLTDAEQIAELCRTGLVTRTQLETRPSWHCGAAHAPVTATDLSVAMRCRRLALRASALATGRRGATS
jgi:transposase